MDGAFSGTLGGSRGGSSQTDFTPLRADVPGGQTRLPSGEDFLRADFARSGPDLLIETPSGGHYVLPGYFQAAEPPALETFDGAVLSAKLVAALAGPAAPAMWAQAAAQQGPNLGEPIGQVSAAQGGVTVRHADGTQSVLAAGSSIFQGDVIETGAGAHVGVVFVDDTVFSLDENGRMVMDEMVYDPDAQTGVFNAQVVQGVFSFVSGQVAKTSPEGMVVSTPTNTIGIRGSTVLGRAAAEGAENKITLVRDVDGNVGEIIISNGAGTLVLNQAGASLTVTSFNAPLPTPVILSPAQIQQDFGVALTRLTQVVAQKAESDVARVQEQAQRTGEEAQQAQDEAQQAQDEAQQAEDGAQQADAEAEAAKAEAEAALAEAEAAKAEAEAKGDAEAAAKAQAAEVKAQEAAAKAQATEAKAQAEAAKAVQVKAAAEAKAAEAAAKAAQAAQMQVQAQKVAEFTAVAKTAADAQAKVFQEMVNTGIIQLPPGVTAADVMSFGPGPGGPQGPLGPQGPQGGPQAGLADTVAEGPDAAAKAAFDQAIAGGATPEQAAEAAALAAQGAMQQFGFQQQPVGMPGVGYDPFMGGFMNPFGMPGMNPFGGPGLDPFGGPGLDPMAGMFGDPFGGPYMDPMAGMYMDPYAVAYDPLLGGTIDLFNFFDPTDLYNMFATFDPYGVISYLVDTTETVTTVFGETIIAPPSGAAMSGTYLNSNFYFQWPSLSGAYTVSDAGGTNQLSLDNLSNVRVKVVIDSVTSTTGNVAMRSGYNASDSDATTATISYSSINQFLLADVSVSSFATIDFTTAAGKTMSGDIMVLPTLSAGQTGYVVGGTDGADTISIPLSCTGAIVFGKGGGDTFNFTTTTAKSVTAIGGYTSIDNTDSNSDGIPDGNLNVADYTGITSYNGTAGAGTLGLWVSFNDDITVTDLTTAQSTRLFEHQLWDMATFNASLGNDQLTANSGNYHTINGAAGNDTITVNSGAKVLNVLGADGDDTVTVNASVLSTASAINGGLGTNSLTINSYGGTTSFSNDLIINFNSVTFSASSAYSGVTVTDTAVGNVTFTGSSYSDIFTGGSGVDTITGNSGADVFKYTATTDGGGTGDLIQDFTIGDGDKFNFLGTAFNGANVSGVLDSNNFISGAGTTAASTATQYFIFNSTTGVLYYDADGSGAGAAVTIADMTDGVSFSNAGIVIV